MDLVDVAVLALRLGLVAVLYAFLLVVVRLAASGLRSAGSPPARGFELALRVLEAGASNLANGQLIGVADGATLGRGRQAEISIADAAVSTSHARLARVGRGWTVTDLASTNGTLLNDAPVEAATPLEPGDILALGSVRLEVLAR